MIYIDKIDALARKATPGPWNGNGGCVTCKDTSKNFGVRVIAATPDMRDDDAIYIAAVSPDVWLAMTAELRELREYKETTIQSRLNKE